MEVGLSSIARLMTFNTSCRPISVLVARYTIPIPPLPSA